MPLFEWESVFFLTLPLCFSVSLFTEPDSFFSFVYRYLIQIGRCWFFSLHFVKFFQFFFFRCLISLHQYIRMIFSLCLILKTSTINLNLDRFWIFEYFGRQRNGLENVLGLHIVHRCNHSHHLLATILHFSSSSSSLVWLIIFW